MTEPPAQFLHRAAGKLREIANAAMADGWTGPTATAEAWAPYGNGQRRLIVGSGKRRYDPADPEAWVPTRYIADAEEESFATLIAAAHPGLMLLLADWLDAEARAEETGAQAAQALQDMAADAGAGGAVVVASSTLREALAVAGAVLGEEVGAA